MKAEIKNHWERVSELGCLVSNNNHAELHHCKSGSMSDNGIHTTLSKKNSDWLIIPLSPDYHRGRCGIHHIGVETWEREHGTQIILLNTVSNLLGYDVFEKAGYYFDKDSSRYEKR